MKFVKTTALILVTVFVATIAVAQTADQIISNYFKYTGGKQNWESLQTVAMQLKLTTNGMEMTGTIYSKRPNKMKSVFNFMDKTIINAYDGKDAWMKNPFMPDSSARLAPDAMAQAMKQNEFEPEFLNYAEKGFTVEFTGSDTLNGREVYEIKLTRKNGVTEFHYFDKESYLPVMTKSFGAPGSQNKTEAEVYFSDFRKVDGLTFPFFMESKSGGKTFQKMEFSEIELNKPIDDSFFAFPNK